MPAYPTPRKTTICACGDHAWTIATRGFVILVSPQDGHLLEARSWNATPRNRGKTFYAQAGIKRIKKYLHRLVIDCPEVDHFNHNGLDNRRSNLRACDRGQNIANQKPRSFPNRTSKFKGVSWNKNARKWQVFFVANKNRKYLGLYENELEAAAAHDAVAISVHGEFARLNIGDKQ